jgi:hypothetical protein
MVSLPVHNEVIRAVAAKFMSVVGESELVPDDDTSVSSAYGSPSRPSSGKYSSPAKARSASRKKKGSQESVSSDTTDITDAQTAMIIKGVQAVIETRLEPTRANMGGSSVLAPDQDIRAALSPPSADFPNAHPPAPVSVGQHLAKSYVHLWRCLLDINCSDPHPIVVMAAKAVIFQVKVEVRMCWVCLGEDDVIGWCVVQMIKEKLTAEPSEKSIDEISGAGRRSEGILGYRDIGKDSPRAGSHDIPASGKDSVTTAVRGKPLTPPLFVNITDNSGPQGGGANIRRPMSAGFALDAVNGHFNDKMISEMALVSTVYDWNRKFFLRPDMGYEPVDDLLSPEGRERSNRMSMREEIKDLANRIAESFRVIQDQGLTTLLEKDSADFSFEGNGGFGGGRSSTASNHDMPRSGMPAALLPSSLTRFESRGIIRVENAELTSNAMFHAFHDILAASDDKGVGVWSLESGTQIMHIDTASSKDESSAKFKNGSAFTTTVGSSLITSLTWVNESLDTLVMAGCEDGSVKIWRDVGNSIEEGLQKSNEGDILTTESSGVLLASAFHALPDISGGSVGSGLVMSWQQKGGLLSAGGNSSTIRLWDVSQEKCVTTFQTGMDTCLTAMVAQTASVRGGFDQHAMWGSGIANNRSNSFFPDDNGPVYAWTFAGFADGSIGIYDQRVDTRGGRVHAAKEHNSWIVSAHLRADVPEVIDQYF